MKPALLKSVVAAAVLVGTLVPAATVSSSQATASTSGTLKILQVGLSWPDMDPANPAVGGVRLPMFSIMYDGLWTQNAAGTVSPDLATSWKYNGTGTRLVIDLRKGVKFQDGTPFNAQAVLFNFDRASNATQNSQCRPFFQDVKSETAVNKYQVAVNFSVPFTAFPSDMAAAACSMIISPTAYKKWGDHYGQHPVGTGPYSFASQEVGAYVDYVRFKGYWGAKPSFEAVDLENIGSDASALAAVKSGSAQAFVVNPDPEDVVQAKQAHLKVLESSPAQVAYVKLNLKTAPFNSLTARQAIGYALDQAAITKSLYKDAYKPYNNFWFGLGAKRISGAQPTYDLAKAKALVAKLGGLRFTLQCINSPSQIQLATVVQSELKAAGISVTVTPVDATTLYKGWHAFTYQAGLSTWAGTAPDYTYYYNFDSKSTQNLTGISAPTVDRMISEARAAVSTTAQKKAWTSAQAAEDQVFTWAPMFEEPDFFIESPSLQGLAANPLGALTVAKARLSS